MVLAKAYNFAWQCRNSVRRIVYSLCKKGMKLKKADKLMTAFFCFLGAVTINDHQHTCCSLLVMRHRILFRVNVCMVFGTQLPFGKIV